MIPVQFHPYFWEYNPASIDITSHFRLVIERLLEKGDMDTVAWLISTYGLERVMEVVRQSCNLSFRTINLWNKTYRIYEEASH